MAVLSEMIEKRLADDIVMGHFKVDTKLHIKQLAERYGCGASPIREALSRLLHTKLVRSMGQRGFRTAPVNQQELDDMILALRPTMHACLQLSLQHSNPDWEQQIKHEVQQLELLCQSSSTKAIDVEVQQMNFLGALLDCCPSQWLLRQSKLLHRHLQRYRHILAQQFKQANMRYSCVRQKQMLQSALAGDIDMLKQQMDAYIDKSHRHLSSQLENVEAAPAKLSASRHAQEWQQSHPAEVD